MRKVNGVGQSQGWPTPLGGSQRWLQGEEHGFTCDSLPTRWGAGPAGGLLTSGRDGKRAFWWQIKMYSAAARKG